MSETPDYRQILVNLCAGLYLCDHLGDAADDAIEALRQAGIVIECEDLRDLARQLKQQVGVTTVWGTPLGYEDEDEDDG